MNVLTFDIEDWYNCDFISEDFAWDKHECRIYEGVRRLLDELDRRELKGTFFCLQYSLSGHQKPYRSGPQVPVQDIHLFIP